MGHTGTADPFETLASSPSVSWPRLPNPQPLSQSLDSLDILPQGSIVDPLLTIQLFQHLPRKRQAPAEFFICLPQLLSAIEIWHCPWPR